jgi:hypothetical protein
MAEFKLLSIEVKALAIVVDSVHSEATAPRPTRAATRASSTGSRYSRR